MNKNKIEDILKKAVPPSDIDNEKKQQLRRELLNSKHFEKKGLLDFLFGQKYILAGVFTVLIAVLILVNLNQQVTIDELRQKTNTQYAGFVNSTNYSSFNNDLALFGTDNSEIKFKVEQVVDPVTKNTYIKIFDDKGMEELDELIIKGDNIYRNENPKIKTVGTVSALTNKRLKIIVIDDSITAGSNLTFLSKENDHTPFLSGASSNGYIVYNKPVKINDEIPHYKSEPFYQEVPKEVDIDKYFRTSPIDIANEIDTAKNIEVIGNEFDSYSSEEYQLIQISREINHKIVAAYEIILSQIDSLKNYDIKVESLDSVTKVKLNEKTSWSFVEGDSLTAYKELKTISLSATNGEIKKVRFAILKNDKKITLSEIRFNQQSQVSADTSLFNHKKHGLIFIGKLN